ncbi:MAG: hypothetical protein ACK5TH_13840 [Prosthecobacter sp.]
MNSTRQSILPRISRCIRIMFGAGMVVLVVYLVAEFSGVLSRGSGSHVESVDWLPKSATDVSYCEHSGFLAYSFFYECTMSPENFRVFAEQKGWKPVECVEYFGGSFRGILNLPPLRSDPATLPEAPYPRALVYENVAANGGGIRVIYDPERQRLLFGESTN